MGNGKMRRKTILLLLLSVLLALPALAGCVTQATRDGQVPLPDVNDSQDAPLAHSETIYVGTGSNEFVLEVTNDAGAVSVFNVHTDEVTVGAALLGVGLIEGAVSEFGLMVMIVNGQRADYNEDGAYWAFYIDGEFAVTGVDSTEIELGKVYAFVYTEA